VKKAKAAHSEFSTLSIVLILVFLFLFHTFVPEGIQRFIKTLYAQPAANVDKVEQVFTAYHAHNFAILNYRHLINIILS
jgi:hypothetical protein